MTPTRKYTPATMPAELTRTTLNMRAPRFDAGGNMITGEHDNEKTPDSGIQIEAFKSSVLCHACRRTRDCHDRCPNHCPQPVEPEDLTNEAIVEDLTQHTFADIGGYFCIGVGIGTILFAIGLIISGGFAR